MRVLRKIRKQYLRATYNCCIMLLTLACALYLGAAWVVALVLLMDKHYVYTAVIVLLYPVVLTVLDNFRESWLY